MLVNIKNIVVSDNNKQITGDIIVVLLLFCRCTEKGFAFSYNET